MGFPPTVTSACSVYVCPLMHVHVLSSSTFPVPALCHDLTRALPLYNFMVTSIEAPASLTEI